MSKEVKEQPMFRVTRDKDIKVEFNLKESTVSSLESYVEFLKDLEDQEATAGEILDVLVPQALKKDKAFSQWCASRSPE
jgi:hypothetical protein